MQFLAIDVETANADIASICQVGIATFSDGELIGEWKTLVDPEDYFDPMNMSIHGIGPEDELGAPLFPEALLEMRAQLDGFVAVCHTHFDRTSIQRACDRYHLDAPSCAWLDTARVARRTWEQFSSSGYGLQNVCAHIGYSYVAHDALEDAKAAGIVLIAAAQHSGLSVEEWLCRVTSPIHPRNSQESCARDGNPEGDLSGEVMVFTGALCMPRNEAADLASTAGSRVDENVTKRTTILVVGDQDVARLAGHDKSSKHRKAEELILSGQPLRILRESDFLAIVRTNPQSEPVMPGEQASWQFGFNCRNFMPTLRRCQVLRDSYSRRSDLLTSRWVDSGELLTYLGLPDDEVLRMVDACEIGVKFLKKDGSPRFLVEAPWAWDMCPLAAGGGLCLYFEAHDGEKISCLQDLERRTIEHPNLQALPTPGAIADFEGALPGVPTTTD